MCNLNNDFELANSIHLNLRKENNEFLRKTEEYENEYEYEYKSIRQTQNSFVLNE